MTDFMVTLLPEPDSPTTARKSPSYTVRSTPRTAWTSWRWEWNVVRRLPTRRSSCGEPGRGSAGGHAGTSISLALH